LICSSTSTGQKPSRTLANLQSTELSTSTHRQLLQDSHHLYQHRPVSRNQHRFGLPQWHHQITVSLTLSASTWIGPGMAAGVNCDDDVVKAQVQQQQLPSHPQARP
jgi:hypothetical protein